MRIGSWGGAEEAKRIIVEAIEANRAAKGQTKVPTSEARSGAVTMAPPRAILVP